MEQPLPNSVEELKRLVQTMRAEHDRHIRDLQEQLRSERTQRIAERNERIEQANKAIGYFEEIQLDAAQNLRPKRRADAGDRPSAVVAVR